MGRITVDYSNALNFIDEKEILNSEEKVKLYHNMLHDKTGQGNEYLGWIDLPNRVDTNEIEKINKVANKIKEQSDVFIVVGIGGSYLGSRAAMEMLNHSFYNELPKHKRKGPKVYFAGHNISSTYLKNLLEIIDGQDVSINVISKSGTTIEPALAFRTLKKYMENKYGKEETKKRIYVTTDKSKGALKELSDKEGYETFIVPDDIGGRYSVLTPVGLLPMAVANINIEEVLDGAKKAFNDLNVNNIAENHCYKYAVIRNLLYSKEKTTEIMVSYEPNLFYFGEWFKQLFGESEGKEGKGIFPTYLSFSTDLHSMGQYIQQGRENIFETVLDVEKSKEEIIVEESQENIDGLNYISGKKLEFVNKSAMEGTISAHVQGRVPNIRFNIPEISAYYFGYLAYFFEIACAMSGYILRVNPFDQPGVEAYKKEMLELLKSKDNK